MSKIDEMLKQMCPDGVEYVELGNVCDVCKGTQLNKEKLHETGIYPVINGGIAPSGYWEESNVMKDTITISQGGASAGYVNWIDVNFWAGAHCFYIANPKQNMVYRFIFHFLKMKQSELMLSQIGAGIPSVSKDKICKLLIPLPPLEIQKEVVKVLDTFTKYDTELQAELQAELQDRIKQYEYYRDKLLTFEPKA